MESLAVAAMGGSGCRSAAFVFGGGGGRALGTPGGFGQSPAAGAAREAAFLLVGGLWRGIHQTKDLVERLTRFGVARREPALAIVWARLPVAAPVQALAWIFGDAKVHVC